MGNTLISYVWEHGFPVPEGYDPTMQNFGARTPLEEQTQTTEFHEQYAKEGNLKFSPSALLIGKLLLSDKAWTKSTFMKGSASVCVLFEVVLRIKGIIIVFFIDIYKGFESKGFSFSVSKANIYAISDAVKMLVNYLNKGGK